MEQNCCWNQYWKELLEEKKLVNFVNAMNEADQVLKSEIFIEDICHKIYDDYHSSWKKHLDAIRMDFLKMLEEFQFVHLQTSRVKILTACLKK